MTNVRLSDIIRITTPLTHPVELRTPRGYLFLGGEKMPSSPKAPYQKPSLNFSAQLEQLKRRGLKVDDDQYALHYLSHLNYYRLGAYWLPFEADHSTHQFYEGISFKDVLNLYIFDREFRLLLLDAIERIEVSVRTQFAYHLSQKYGPHPHLDSSLFHDQARYSSAIGMLKRDVRDSEQRFIKHLKSKYIEDLPPVWAVVELMSFGTLSKWYENLEKRADKKLIADTYDLDGKSLGSFLEHLAYLRNLCAHHSRVWNRNFTKIPSLPRKRPANLLSNFNLEKPMERKVYNTLVLLAYFMDLICPGNHFKQRLKSLISEHNITTRNLGFPDDWEKRPLWRELV